MVLKAIAAILVVSEVMLTEKSSGLLEFTHEGFTEKAGSSAKSSACDDGLTRLSIILDTQQLDALSQTQWKCNTFDKG
jgi:hypothetical protein